MRIDTHIPIPETTNRGQGRPSLYPFAQLPVGGSFAAAPDQADKIGTAARIWKQRHPGWDYRTRKSVDEFRVWRIK